MAKRYIKDVFKFQKPMYGDGLVLVYNEDRSIIGHLPMDACFELLFGDQYKIYCECKYRDSDGFLKIGREVEAYW